MSSHVFVSTESNFPEDDHWVILTFDSVSIPGDERSRTNPGHGYGAHTKSIVTYQAFTDFQEFKAEIARLESREYGRKAYRALHVSPLKVTKDITIEVG